MKNKLTLLLLLPFFLLLTSCGSDRGSHALTEWAAALWTFDISGQSPVTYMFSGGMIGDMFIAAGEHAGAAGNFTYQKTGDNSGILTVVIDPINRSEVFQLSFSSPDQGTFTVTRSDLSIYPPTVENLSGSFAQE